MTGAATQPIADPYSLAETRFMEGYAETFAENAEDAEMSKYAEFHALKLALRDNGGIVGANDYSPLQRPQINSQFTNHNSQKNVSSPNQIITLKTHNNEKEKHHYFSYHDNNGLCMFFNPL